MTTLELIQSIRTLEIKTKGLSKQVFSGQYKSAFKGRGMAFSEVRDYQIGDEIRTIDWNVTARYNTPFVKVFEEERELTVMLLIDLSGSLDFGTELRTKKKRQIEIAAILAFSALANNDKVGAILFTDEVELYLPAKKGREHVLLILRQLIDYKPKSKKTDIGKALKFLRETNRRSAVAFLMSDFIVDTDYVEDLKRTKKQHDVVALRIQDDAEITLPVRGFIQLVNAENKTKTWVNASSNKAKEIFSANVLKNKSEMIQTFRNIGIDFVSINTAEDCMPPLISLFKKRK